MRKTYRARNCPDRAESLATGLYSPVYLTNPKIESRKPVSYVG